MSLGFSSVNTKNIGNSQTSQGYIFCIAQHFPTKLCSLLILNVFNALFIIVIKDLLILRDSNLIYHENCILAKKSTLLNFLKTNCKLRYLSSHLSQKFVKKNMDLL